MTQAQSSFMRINDHLTRSVALDELAPPYMYLTGTVLITLFLGVFVFWSSVTPIDEVASAAGQVIPSGQVQVIQHLEGGIVEKVMVEEGQRVEEGQVLAILDITRAKTDLDRLKMRENALALQAQRLKKFAEEDGYHTGEKADLTDNEAAILASMQVARDQQKNVITNQIAQKKQEIAGINSIYTTLKQNKELLEKENAIHEEMFRTGAGSQLMAMNSRRELNQVSGQLNELATQRVRAQEAVRELQNRLLSLDADLKQDAMKNWGTIEAELNDVRTAMAQAKNTLELTSLRSPVNGIVKGLTLHTEGGVIEPGKPLMEIVPVEHELIIEAMLPPSDIGDVQEGQAVKVKISAYDFSRFGNIEGRLTGVSASTFQGEEGNSFYKVRVKLDKNYVGSNPERHQIAPGMQAQVDIITGNKTILQYLLKPVRVAMDTALSES